LPLRLIAAELWEVQAKRPPQVDALVYFYEHTFTAENKTPQQTISILNINGKGYKPLTCRLPQKLQLDMHGKAADEPAKPSVSSLYKRRSK